MTAVVADLSSNASCHRAIEEAAEALGGAIDVLVLNHIVGWCGVLAPSAVRRPRARAGRYDWWTDDIAASIAATPTIFAVNTLSYIYLASHALPYVTKTNG